MHQKYKRLIIYSYCWTPSKPESPTCNWLKTMEAEDPHAEEVTSKISIHIGFAFSQTAGSRDAGDLVVTFKNNSVHLSPNLVPTLSFWIHPSFKSPSFGACSVQGCKETIQISLKVEWHFQGFPDFKTNTRTHGMKKWWWMKSTSFILTLWYCV